LGFFPRADVGHFRASALKLQLSDHLEIIHIVLWLAGYELVLLELNPGPTLCSQCCSFKEVHDLDTKLPHRLIKRCSKEYVVFVGIS